MKFYLKRVSVVVMLMVAMLMTAACSTSSLNIAAKSIITVQEAYDATMKACADAHDKGLINEDAKAEIIVAGKLVHDSLALAQTALITCLDASTPENESKLAAAIDAMRKNLGSLIDKAVAFGVTLNDSIKHYGGSDA